MFRPKLGMTRGGQVFHKGSAGGGLGWGPINPLWTPCEGPVGTLLSLKLLASVYPANLYSLAWNLNHDLCCRLEILVQEFFKFTEGHIHSYAPLFRVSDLASFFRHNNGDSVCILRNTDAGAVSQSKLRGQRVIIC